MGTYMGVDGKWENVSWTQQSWFERGGFHTNRMLTARRGGTKIEYLKQGRFHANRILLANGETSLNKLHEQEQIHVISDADKEINYSELHKLSVARD